MYCYYLFLSGGVEIENLYLKYDKGSDAKAVLQDINLRVESGEKVGIVGRTGAGKSSIIAALYRWKFLQHTMVNFLVCGITGVDFVLIKNV